MMKISNTVLVILVLALSAGCQLSGKPAENHLSKQTGETQESRKNDSTAPPLETAANGDK